MGKLFSLACLVLLGLLLSACNVVVTVDPPVVRWPAGVTVADASYESSFYFLDGQGNRRYVICNNRETSINYSFVYTGSLQSWTSYLQGQRTGRQYARANYTPSNPGGVYSAERIRAGFTVFPNMAPTAVTIDPQSIVITPTPIPSPTIAGYSNLFLTIRGSFGEATNLFSNPIPVVNNC